MAEIKRLTGEVIAEGETVRAAAEAARSKLRDADLRGAVLIRADLRGADLRGAVLTDANLVGADLTDAHTDD